MVTDHERTVEFLKEGRDIQQHRYVLYADPRIASDQKSIKAFSLSPLPGVVVPTGASAGGPELVCGEQTIVGNESIQDYLRKTEVGPHDERKRG